MTTVTFYEQLEQLHVMLGGNPEDMVLIEEREAVELLDLLTDANRKTLLHVATVSRNTTEEIEIDFLAAVARLHRADPKVLLFAWGWTPRPGVRITQQQHVALRLAMYLLGYLDWEFECGDLPN